MPVATKHIVWLLTRLFYVGYLEFVFGFKGLVQRFYTVESRPGASVPLFNRRAGLWLTLRKGAAHRLERNDRYAKARSIRSHA
jgi:hypothetical protein